MKMKHPFEFKGPLHEIIRFDGLIDTFNVYRFDFPNHIRDIVSKKYPELATTLAREGYLDDTYYVLEKGNVKYSEKPLVRIHSACFHGDTLGHLICDCKQQYERALKMISKEGQGLLIYCEKQDGRGINKKLHFQSYLDQQNYGWNTFESYRKRGLKEDIRDYSNAIAILKFYGLKKIRLLTNNPDKIKPIEKSGISVERVPIWTDVNSYNKRQIDAKLERGHLKDEIKGGDLK